MHYVMHENNVYLQISGMHGWILLHVFLRLHLVQEHRWSGVNIYLMYEIFSHRHFHAP